MKRIATTEGPSVGVSIGAWLVYLFLIAPSLIVIPMAFGNPDELEFPPRSWSFALYQKMLDPTLGWIEAISRSTQVALVTAIFSVLLGVAAAYGLERSSFRGKRIVEMIFLSPVFVPSIVVALALYICFSYLGFAGSFVGLVLSHVLVTAPFVIVTARAALKQVDRNVEIAADVMGATRLQTLLRVVIPQLRAAMLSAGLLAFLLSFDEVVIAWFVGASANPTLPVKMYSSLQWEISPVLAAVSSMLLLVTCVLCVAAAVIKKDPAI